MTITTSITAVGIIRATELIQSARTEAALDHREGLHTVSVEVGGATEIRAQEQEGRPTPMVLQKRVVDIRV